MIRTVVFDVSGVLRDSSIAMTESFERAFSRFGMKPAVNLSTLWSIRGLPSFNDLSNATALLYASCVMNVPVDESIFSYSNRGIDKNGEEKEPRNEDNDNSTSNPELPLFQLIRSAKLSKEQMENVRKIKDDFRIHFSADDVDTITILPGVEKGLKRLKEENFTLGVLSNSTEKSLKRDIGSLYKYFDFHIGDAKKPDPTKFKQILQSKFHIEFGTHALEDDNNNLKIRECAYVGDASSDVILAKRVGCVSIAILSGMGKLEWLKKENPDYIVKDFDELVSLLIEHNHHHHHLSISNSKL